MTGIGLLIAKSKNRIKKKKKKNNRFLYIFKTIVIPNKYNNLYYQTSAAVLDYSINRNLD